MNRLTTISNMPPGKRKRPPIKTGKPNIVNINTKTINNEVIDKLLTECNDSSFYHQFVIYGATSYNKNFILKTILNHVFPAYVIPIHFENGLLTSSFLAQNCQDFIQKLVADKFLVPLPDKPEQMFRILINRNYIAADKIDRVETDNVMEVLKTRYDNPTEMLNLKNFGEDEYLKEYTPLFQPTLQRYVMQLASEFCLKILDLQDNDLRNIMNLHPLQSCPLETIILSNNLISSMIDLSVLTGFKNLKNLKLSGNPICAKYNSYNYVLDMKRLCPQLENLDDVDVLSPVFKKNFLCCPDAEDFACQFLEHFFHLYDLDDRGSLVDLYDKDAIFSVNSKIIPKQPGYRKGKLEPYGLNHQFAVKGISDIMKVYDELPRTNHDPHTFVCDVTLYTKSYAALAVSGTFRDGRQILIFNRHFLFIRKGEEFCIINEQLHVSNALKSQMARIFRFPTHAQPLVPYFPEDYRKLEEALHKITKMNREYCVKYLDICHYDIKRTLDLFSESYLRNVIPQIAFDEDRDNDTPVNESYCKRITEDVKRKYKIVTDKTVWDMLNKRMTNDYKQPLPRKIDGIQKMYLSIKIPELIENQVKTTTTVAYGAFILEDGKIKLIGYEPEPKTESAGSAKAAQTKSLNNSNTVKASNVTQKRPFSALQADTGQSKPTDSRGPEKKPRCTPTADLISNIDLSDNVGEMAVSLVSVAATDDKHKNTPEMAKSTPSYENSYMKPKSNESSSSEIVQSDKIENISGTESNICGKSAIVNVVIEGENIPAPTENHLKIESQKASYKHIENITAQIMIQKECEDKSGDATNTSIEMTNQKCQQKKGDKVFIQPGMQIVPSMYTNKPKRRLTGSMKRNRRAFIRWQKKEEERLLANRTENESSDNADNTAISQVVDVDANKNKSKSVIPKSAAGIENPTTESPQIVEDVCIVIDDDDDENIPNPTENRHEILSQKNSSKQLENTTDLIKDECKDKSGKIANSPVEMTIKECQQEQEKIQTSNKPDENKANVIENKPVCKENEKNSIVRNDKTSGNTGNTMISQNELIADPDVEIIMKKPEIINISDDDDDDDVNHGNTSVILLSSDDDDEDISKTSALAVASAEAGNHEKGQDMSQVIKTERKLTSKLTTVKKRTPGRRVSKQSFFISQKLTFLKDRISRLLSAVAQKEGRVGSHSAVKYKNRGKTVATLGPKVNRKKFANMIGRKTAQQRLGLAETKILPLDENVPVKSETTSSSKDISKEDKGTATNALTNIEIGNFFKNI